MKIRDNLPILSAGTPATATALLRDGPPTEDEEQGGISPTQIIVMLLAYWKVSAIIAVTLLTVALTAIKFMPKTFTAVATLMVNNDIKDPLAGKDVTGQALTLGYIPTEIQLMYSSEVLLQVVDQLHLTEVKEYRAGYLDNGSSLREWVKNRLIKDLEIAQGAQNSLLINVAASARDPFRAANIANAIADIYVENQKARLEKPASERAKRYAEQLTELKAKVSAAQDQVAAFRQRTGVVDLSQQKSNESDILSSMERHLEDVQNSRRSAEVRALADQGNSAAALNSGPVQNLRNQLNNQEAQLAQLTSTLGPRHPKVLELQSQMEATRRAIADETRTYSTGASGEVMSTRQLESKMQRAIADQSAKVLAIRKLQDEGNKLMLELDSAQSVYKRALDGYDQIMFASAGNYNYVNIVSRAVPPQKSSKPNKVKLALMAVVFALGCGVAGPLAYELFLNRRIRCADDLEKSFGVPVLVEFDATTAASPA